MPFQKGNTVGKQFERGNRHGVGKAIIGKGAFEKYLSTHSCRLKNGILAKCYDCMGFYADGTMDCGCPDCPLYPWMPYKEKEVLK